MDFNLSISNNTSYGWLERRHLHNEETWDGFVDLACDNGRLATNVSGCREICLQRRGVNVTLSPSGLPQSSAELLAPSMIYVGNTFSVNCYVVSALFQGSTIATCAGPSALSANILGCSELLCRPAPDGDASSILAGFTNKQLYPDAVMSMALYSRALAPML